MQDFANNRWLWVEKFISLRLSDSGEIWNRIECKILINPDFQFSLAIQSNIELINRNWKEFWE